MALAKNRTFVFGALCVAGMAVTVGTALGFEHLAGFIPCKLCLEQRDPYYAGVIAGVIALGHMALTGRDVVARIGFGLIACAMLYGTYLGVFHSGVEWGWWPGPTDCTATTLGSQPDAGNLLAAIDAVKPPACDEAAGRFLGLSFAGWNVIASLAMAGMAAMAARGGSMRSA